MAAIMKIEKRPYYRNCLIDRREIWSGDAYDPTNLLTIKISSFLKSKMVTDEILNTAKSQMRLPILQTVTATFLNFQYYLYF